MLTVMHRGPDGSERIFEADFVTRFPKEGEETCPPMGKIAVTGCTHDGPSDFELALEKPFGAVFVMNRYGQTVARYMA